MQGINEADTLVDLANVQVYDLKLIPLDANEFIAVDTVGDILPGCFHPPVHHA